MKDEISSFQGWQNSDPRNNKLKMFIFRCVWRIQKIFDGLCLCMGLLCYTSVVLSGLEIETKSSSSKPTEIEPVNLSGGMWRSIPKTDTQYEFRQTMKNGSTLPCLGQLFGYKNGLHWLHGYELDELWWIGVLQIHSTKWQICPESRTGMLQAQVQHWQRKLLRRSPGRRTKQPTGEAKVRSHAETVSKKEKGMRNEKETCVTCVWQNNQNNCWLVAKAGSFTPWRRVRHSDSGQESVVVETKLTTAMVKKKFQWIPWTCRTSSNNMKL